MVSTAYVFVRKNGAALPTGCAGHVGWAFTDGAGVITAGSTENPSGRPWVNTGDDNGAWFDRFESEAALLAEISAETPRHPAYDALKILEVRAPRAADAEAYARTTPQLGYSALGNNCLDHAHRVLSLFGEQGLPWPQTHPSPNEWFSLLIGEYRSL